MNSLDNFGVRASVLWRPTSDLNVTLSGDWNLQDPVCCAQIYARVGTTQRALNRQYAALIARFPGYQVPSTDPFDRLTDLDAAIRARNEHGGLSARIQWDLGAVSLNSVTAWRYWDWTPANDRDFTGLPIALKVNNPTRQDQATQEFRYAFTGQKFDYVVGLFGYRLGFDDPKLQFLMMAFAGWGVGVIVRKISWKKATSRSILA